VDCLSTGSIRPKFVLANGVFGFTKLARFQAGEDFPAELKSLGLRDTKSFGLRWQIELLFKLDTLPSREGPTAKSWMLAQRLDQPSGGPLSAWGYDLRTNPEQNPRTHSPWSCFPNDAVGDARRGSWKKALGGQ
jgi:hypothetical protein